MTLSTLTDAGAMLVLLTLFAGVALAAVILQFTSLIVRKGQDSVVSLLTWVLLASFAAAIGGYTWKTYEDVFAVVLMGLLSLGAILCFVFSFSKRKVLAEVAQARKAAGTATFAIEDTAAELRMRLQARRQQRAA